MFFLSNLASANADSTEQKSDKILSFLGKYQRVEEWDEYQRYADSARGTWHGGRVNSVLPGCTIGAPDEIRVVEILQLLPEGKMSRSIEGGPFPGTSKGTWQQNGDTLLIAVGGQNRKYLIEGKKLLDLNVMLNIDSQGNKEIYYRPFRYKYYLKMAG